MREIPLANGKGIALVDDEDFARFGQQCWKNVHGYAGRSYRNETGLHTEYLHRVIIDAKKSEQVDHKNRLKLDCQRSNLRIATATENQQNKSKHINNTSGFVGVTWVKRFERWQAQIRSNNKTKWLGYFIDPAEAARNYDAAKRELHGAEHGVFNFP